MKKYLRLLFAFGFGVVLLLATMATVSFLEVWLPENGILVSQDVFLGCAVGAVGLAFLAGAKLCLREARKLEPSKQIDK